MTAKRLFAVVLIFAVAATAWAILGQTIEYRTASLNDSLAARVETLWGPADVVQEGPALADPDAPRAEIVSAAVRAEFDHANRYKGLLWFSTYTVRFSGTYGVSVAPVAGKDDARPASLLFAIPRGRQGVMALDVTVDGQPVDPRPVADSPNTLAIPLAPSARPHAVVVSYTGQGRDRWSYRPVAETGAVPGLIRQLAVTLVTNFKDIDYPANAVSPTTPAQPKDDGMVAQWQYTNTRSRPVIGLEMPRRPNAGPVAARMSFFAPVSLLFFFTAIFTVVVLKKISLHPMHYLFIAAGFFAFHILLSYLVDIVNIHVAFWICAAVSVFLVVSYMRLVAGVRFAATFVALAQLVYLVGFSYAFFWPGKTGLAVTIGAIATLFVLMQATGKVNWHAVFAPPASVPPPPLPLRPAAAAAPVEPV